MTLRMQLILELHSLAILCLKEAGDLINVGGVIAIHDIRMQLERIDTLNDDLQNAIDSPRE